MPTNSDKWYLGDLPVSKAFMGETQVYPVDDGGGCFPGDDVFTYSVVANSGPGARQSLMKEDDRPVYYATKSPSYYIYENVDGLPDGVPTAYPVADGAPYKGAGAIQVAGSYAERDRLWELVAEKTPSQNGLVPLEAVSGYETMGDCLTNASDMAQPQILYLLPENDFAPCMYHYTIRQKNGSPFAWSKWTFDGGAGKGVGDFVFISAEPLFGFETTSLREQLSLMAQAVAEGWVSKEDLDETTDYYKKRGLL